MRHAFLILAHNEFEVLSELVSALDKPSNDIFIHFDRKVRNLPVLKTQLAGLIILNNRIRSKWGDVSLAEVELNLLEKAVNAGKYDYFHIISGTHFPLKPMEAFDTYFESLRGANVLMPMETSSSEIEMKIGKTHFFLSHLVDKRKAVRRFYHFLWLCTLALQKHRVKDVSFVTGKASQWCSLNEESAKAIVAQREDILKKYRNSFCCDEFFMRSFLEKQGLPIVFRYDLCYVDFVNTAPRNLTENDYEMLSRCSCLFARKVTGEHIGLVKKLRENL